MKSKKQIFGMALSAVLIVSLAVLGVTYYQQIWAVLTQQAARMAFVNFVRDSGPVGLLAFVGVQILQVIVAVLPGEPVEVMAGVLYGTWGGLLVAMAGLGCGSALVYCVVKSFGAQSVDAALLHRYRFLRDDAHVHFFLFLLFFVPGTPKDMLLYIGPFLPVRAHTFFFIVLLARIPSVITSTYAGANFIEGRWQVSVLVFVVTGAVALLCIWQHENLISLLKKHAHLEKTH